MSSSKTNPPETDSAPQREKVWTTTPRPNPPPKGEFDNSVHMARHHAKVQQKLRAKGYTAELLEEVTKAMSKHLDIHAGQFRARQQRKRNNRTAYKQRTTNQLRRLGAQTTDLTSPDNKISLNVRVNLYARNHKCPHKNCFNVVRKVDNKFVFSCLCSKAKRLPDLSTPVKCAACGTTSARPYVNPATQNRFVICPRCKRSNFIDPSPHFYDVKEVEPGVTVTLDPAHKNPHQAPDVVQTDFKSFLDKNVVRPSTTRRDTRKEFFRSLQGKSQRPRKTWAKLPEVTSTDQGAFELDPEVKVSFTHTLFEAKATLTRLLASDPLNFREINDVLHDIRKLKRALGMRVTMADAPYGLFVRLCEHNRHNCSECTYSSSEDMSDVESEDQGAYESAPPAVTFLELITANLTTVQLEAAYARIQRACGLYNIPLVNENLLSERLEMNASTDLRPEPAGQRRRELLICMEYAIIQLINAGFTPSDYQGATFSAASSTVSSMGDSLKSALLDMKTKIFKSIDDFIRNSVASYSQTWIADILRRVLHALKHFLNLLYLNLNCISAMNLYNIIHHLREGNYIAFALCLFTHYSVMKEREKADHTEFLKFLGESTVFERADFHYKPEVWKTFASRLPLFNVARTIIMSIAETAPPNVRLTTVYMAEQVRQSLWFYRPQDVDADQGAADMFAMLANIFDFVPSHLSQGARVLAKVAKEVIPIFSLVKGANDVTKIVKNIYETIINYITGAFAKAHEWLDHEIATKGTKIQELVADLAYYRMAVAEPSKYGCDTTSFRTSFFKKLAEAHDYYRSHKFYAKWLEFSRRLEEAMNIAPAPRQREFEPCVLTLSGSPGMGKSTIWPAIVAKEVLPDPIPAEHSADPLAYIMSQTYTWTTGSEYQVGMSGKDIILFDDFQQDRTKNEEALAFIHLATTAAYAINSPAITGPEIKGMLADPKIIVLCTNQDHLASGQQIADPIAILRRYEVEFQVLARYEENNPTKKIAIVKACNLYKGLIGTHVSLLEMRTIFQTVYRRKKANFAETKRMIASETLSAIKVENLHLDVKADFDILTGPAWQSNMNFIGDLETFMGIKLDCKAGQPAPSTMQFGNDVPVQSRFPERRFVHMPPDYRREQNPADFDQAGPDMWHVSMFYDLIGIILRRGITFATEAAVGNYILNTLTDLCIDLPSFFSLKGLKAKLKQFLKCTLTTCLGLGAIVTAFNWWTNNPYAEDQSGTTRTAKQAQTRSAVPPQITTNDQSGSDSFEFLAKNFQEATLTIKRSDSNLRLNAIAIGGHFILTNRHFFFDRQEASWMPIGTVITVNKRVWDLRSQSFHFDPTRLRPITGSVSMDGDSLEYRNDLVLYELPNKLFSAFPNIIRHFWDGTLELKNALVCRHDFIPYNSRGEWDPVYENHTGTVVDVAARTWRVEGAQRIFHVAARATYTDRVGSCGTIVRLPGQQSPIIGIHMAAGANTSLFHLVTRQQLEAAVASSHVIDLPTDYQACQDKVDYLPFNSTLIPVGQTRYPIFQPIRTDLQPSLVYEALGPHKTEPSILTYRDPRNTELPTYHLFQSKLFEGFAARPGGFAEDELEWAKSTMVDQIKKISSQSVVSMKQLSLLEAINGLPIKDNVRMDMTTSCGYPYHGPKKKDLFYEKDGVIYPTETIVNDYNIAYNALLAGNVPLLPFALTYKDERLKLAKIVNPRTRIFACGNVIHYLIMRTHFYTRLMQMYHSPIGTLWCHISLDRLSAEWHDLASHLLSVGDRAFDFDFKNYDRTLSHFVIHETVDILLTGADWLLAREKNALIEMLASPYSAHGTHMFHSTGINMSGNLLTFVLNCTANELFHRAAYFKLASRFSPNHASILAYHANVRGIRGGDDTLTVVSDEVSEWYNGVTVAHFLNNRGLEVTSAEKDQPIVRWKNFFECSFLKNKTSYNFRGYGLYLPLPDLDSLIESCYWMRLNKFNRDPVKATSDNVNAALRGIFFHGKSTFDSIRDAFLKHEPRLTLLSFLELDTVWGTYFHFPLAHPDQPTAAEMQERFKTNAQKTQVATAPGSDNNTMNPIPSQYQSGEDKAAIADKQHVHAPVDSQINKTDAENTAVKEAGAVTKTESTKTGTTVQDSAQTTVKPVVTGALTPSSKNNRAEAYLNDEQWNLSMLYSKYTLLANINWTTSQAADTVLLEVDVPSGFLVTPALKSPVDLTRFMRFSQLKVKVVVKPSPMYAGSLIQAFFPYGINKTTARAVNMGAVVLKLSQDEGVEFNIPFRYHRGFLRIPGQDIGKYQLRVLTPLRTGANNANNISIAIYFCFDGCEFKVPDIIKATNYFSHKLDLDPKSVISRDQAGPNTEMRETTCNINDQPTKMPATKMCAGIGLVPPIPVQQFQDTVEDLITPLKRWRTVSRFAITAKASHCNWKRFRVSDIRLAAADYLSDMFVLFRGSVDVRIRSFNDTEPQYHSYLAQYNSRVRYIEDNEVKSVAEDEYHQYDGVHRFDIDTPAQFTIPYIYNTFTLPFTENVEIDPVIQVELNNLGKQDILFLYEMDVALADDFHVGLYMGVSDKSLFSRFNVAPTESGQYELTVYQGGITEHSERAVETLLPISEIISDLGHLLDAEDVTYQPDPVSVRKYQNEIACDIPRYTDRLKVTNHNGMSLPDTECFGTPTTEANLYNLLTETKSLQTILQWKASDPQGTELYSGPVGPTISGTGVHDIVPLGFQYWTGGTSYIIDVICSQMHRGQLKMTYAIDQSSSPAYANVTQTYFTTVDISNGRGTIKIDFPYLSNTPYCAVQNPWVHNIGSQSFAPGIFTIFVQNELRATEVVAPVVDVVIYKTYLKDFRLAVWAPLGARGPVARQVTRRAIKRDPREQRTTRVRN